ncbi:hypothetical protein [Pseudomonas urmiensis]|jgi:hypothetical protein|uniref:hypothetical protein n=1 Tax=Pseudomonas urmiensis TaxID=2745493 RepID=UPI003D0DF554
MHAPPSVLVAAWWQFGLGWGITGDRHGAGQGANMALDAGVAGLIGAGIGAASSVITIWIQSHYSAKRERAKAVLDFSIRHRAEVVENSEKIAGPVTVLPLAVYVHFQEGMLRMVESGKVTPEKLVALRKQNDDLVEQLSNMDSPKSTDTRRTFIPKADR